MQEVETITLKEIHYVTKENDGLKIGFTCPEKGAVRYPYALFKVPFEYEDAFPIHQDNLGLVIRAVQGSKQSIWYFHGLAEESTQSATPEEVNETVTADEESSPDTTPQPKSNEHFDSLDLPPLITNADRYNGVNERYTQWKMDARTAFMQAAGRSDIPVDEIEYQTLQFFRLLRDIGPLAQQQELAEEEADQAEEQGKEDDTSTAPSS
jgi:hypothetical protein